MIVQHIVFLNIRALVTMCNEYYYLTIAAFYFLLT